MVRQLAAELMEARRSAGLSQAALAEELRWSQSDVSRFERLTRVDGVSFVELSEVASLLGLELGAGLHLVGDPIRDKGHQALIARFRALLSAAWRVVQDVPLPIPGDRRAWDLLLRLADQLIGVEAETKVRDVQALTRHVHLRERDGRADEIVVLLADTRTDRALVDQLRLALGSRYATSPKVLLKALRSGERLLGSGVILL
jgi:transcriptional regulator with XRE-family HTH domain